MALKATGAFCSWPPMQIAPLTRTGLSVLNLVSFFTGLPDSSGKYCGWAYFMMALEAVSIYINLILPWLDMAGTLHLDLTN